MNEHDGLDPTVGMPRVEVVPAASGPQYYAPQALPAQLIPAQRVTPQRGAAPIVVEPRAAFVYGNPFVYALRRFFAFGLDFVVVTSVATMLLYGLIAINPFSGLPTTSEGGFDATLGIGAAIALLYLWLFEAVAGTTLGKLAFSLHVYAPGHRFVGLGRALIRNLLRPVDLCVIGWLLAMAPGHRRLGDLMSGTLVAHSPLRAFSPLVGWVLIIALAAVPFLIGGGSITVLAVAAAFVDFVPALIARALHALLHVWSLSGVHLPTTTVPPR